MAEVGRKIMANAQYAVKKLNEVPGVKANAFGSAFFKEFVVDFNGTGKTVEMCIRDRYSRIQVAFQRAGTDPVPME